MVVRLITAAQSALDDYCQPLSLGELSLVENGILASAFTSGHYTALCFLCCILLAPSVFRAIALALTQQNRECEAKYLHQLALPRKLSSSPWDLFGIQKVREAAQHKLNNTYLDFTLQRFRKFDFFTYTSSLFGRSVIDTIEPLNIQAVLSTNFQDWSLGAARNELWAPLLGQGIFAADGHAWKRSRTRLRPTANLDTGAHFPIFEKHVQSLLSICSSQGQKAIDMSSLFFRFTLDTASELFFGQCCGSLQEALDTANNDSSRAHSKIKTVSSNAFTQAFNRAQRRLADKLVLGKLSRIFLSPRTHREFAHDCSTVHSFIDDCVNSAIKDLEQSDGTMDEKVDSDKNSRVLLHNLLRAGVDPTDAKYDLVNMLVAGRDTTASLLSNLFFELARAPRVYAKLRQEVTECLGSSKASASNLPTHPQLRRMKYLRACIDEALRLYPPVPLNSRTAIRDTILPCGGGSDGKHPIFVPKNTRVAYNIYAMHRRKDIWGEDADVFRPERWFERRDRSSLTDWEFLPFSGGPRVCLGRYLAMAEAQYVVCRLVQHFSEILADAYDLSGDIDRNCSLRYGEIAKSACMDQNVRGCSDAVPWKWTEDLSLTLSCGGGTWIRFLRTDAVS